MKIMIVAAHPDDEVLGCGGTIARHVAAGDIVKLVVMTDGVSSRKNTSHLKAKEREKALRISSKTLGIQKFHHLDFPDNQMDSVPLLKIVQAIEPLIENARPDIIYTHHPGDLNVDHRQTQAAVLTACRPCPGNSLQGIFGFEIISSTEWAKSGADLFVPDTFIDISHYLSVKLKALKAYSEEIHAAPHARSMEHVETLARHRGFSVGVQAAEAFVTFRRVQK